AWSKELSLRYLAKMKIDFGEDDIALVDPLINLANAELILGNSHKGLSYALRASELTIGYAESHHTLPDEEALDALVLAELSLGHQTEATRHAFMALQYAEQRSGLNHPYTSHAYQQLASAIRDKQPSIAVTLLKRSILLDWSSVDVLPDSDRGHLRNMQTVIKPHCERLNDWLTRDHRQRETSQWRTGSDACSQPPVFTKDESNWLTRYDDISRRRISLDRPIRLLKLEDEQGSVNASDLRLMNQLESRIGMRKAELNQLFNDRMLRSRKSTPSLDRGMVGLMQKRFSREKEKTGWVHYESSETALKITLITELQINEVSLDLGVDTLKKHIKASQFNTDSLRSLYLILIAPIRDFLIQQHITALWIDPKGFASGIPFAALTDGERELIHNYAFAFVSPQWIHDEKTIRRSMTIAGFGLSNEVSGLRELPWVRRELHDLEALNRDDGVSVRTYLDDSFTEHAVEKEIAKGSTIFHFATHFIDSPGTRDSSSLLLGDGHHLSSERLTNLIRGKNISLISLSACNTATASQRLEDSESAEDSLITNLLGGGIGSVIGTLWKIEDHDSYEFMLRFYSNYLKAPDSISRAFHETQVELAQNGSSAHWESFILYHQ
ncbi:MAG: CHAT domain-containing protein, partial [Gammaproteobacteria bacterium]|nr:CHAT domain-containing protein [Gammaproteobacteria bacterium]